MKLMVSTVLFLIVSLGTYSAAQGAELLEVKPVGTAPAIAVEIRADIPMTYSYYKVPGQTRAVVDIADVDPEKIEPLIVVNKGAVASISVDKAQIEGMAVSRVIFSLLSEMEIDVTATADRKLLTVTFGGTPAKPSPAGTAITVSPHQSEATRSDATPAPAGTGNKSATAVKHDPATSKPAAVIIRKIVFGDNYLDIVISGAVSEYKVITLKNPDRIAVDITGAKSALAARQIAVHKFGVSTVRWGIYPNYIRIVIDSAKESLPPHAISKTAGGLRISFK